MPSVAMLSGGGLADSGGVTGEPDQSKDVREDGVCDTAAKIIMCL